MVPSNLCKRHLHKFGVRKELGKLRHVFQVADGVAGSLGKVQFDVLGQILNELVAPGFVGVNDLTNAVIEQKEVGIDVHSSPVLRRANLLLDLLNGGEIIGGVHQHKDGLLVLEWAHYIKSATERKRQQEDATAFV